MIVDALAKLSAAQQITADAVSTSSFDCGNITPKGRISVGRPLVIVMTITAIGTNSGSAKIQAILSAAAALTAPVIIGEVDIAAADLVVGKRVIVPLGQGPTPLRYLGANYDITGTVDFTVDTYVTDADAAAVMPDSYPKNYVV